MRWLLCSRPGFYLRHIYNSLLDNADYYTWLINVHERILTTVVKNSILGLAIGFPLDDGRANSTPYVIL